MNPRVLVVDDEEAIRQLLRRLLSRLQPGLHVDTAESAERALEILERDEYGVVLTDQNMGGRDGISLLLIVRERWPSTSRLLMTGYTDAETRKRAETEAQVAAFLQKPFSNRDLLNLVGGLLPPFRGVPSAPGAPPGEGEREATTAGETPPKLLSDGNA